MLTKNQLCFIIIFICTIFIFHWFASMLDMSVPELMRQFNERKQERNTSKRRPRSSLIYTSKSLSRKCDKSDEKPSTKNYNAFIAGGVTARHTELCCAKPHSQGLSSLVPLHLSCSRGTGVERPWEQRCALKCCQLLVQSPSNSVVLPAAISFFFLAGNASSIMFQKMGALSKPGWERDKWLFSPTDHFFKFCFVWHLHYPRWKPYNEMLVAEF